MSRFSRAAAVLLLCWLLAGCRAGSGPAAPSPTPEAVGGNLVGSQWILTSIQGQAPTAGTQVTLDFEDGELGGSAGCNYYGSSYSLDGSRIKIDVVEQTAMLCEEPAGVMEQEARYLKVLGDAAGQFAAPFRIVDAAGTRRLEITDHLGIPLLVFVEKQRFDMKPEELTGRAWRLVSLEGQPPAGGPVLLYFLNDQEYSGFAGCRHYYGSYQAEGDTIQFPSTFMLGPDCHQNAPLDLQESSYTDGLSRARNFHLEGERLDLLTQQGGVLSFLAEPMGAAELPGTSWKLMAFLGPSPNAQVPFRLPAEPLLQTEITLSFDADQASGSAGCSTYTTVYFIEGDTMTFQPPAAARKQCAQPEGLIQQEQVFLRQLEGRKIYRILGEQLWLDAGDGQTMLFTRKP